MPESALSSTTDVLRQQMESLCSETEVVTVAGISTHRLSSGHTLGLVTLASSVNTAEKIRPATFTPRSLINLNEAYDAVLADDSIDAIALTGTGAFLAAGADLGTFVREPSSQVKVLAEFGHATFRKLRDGAVINGRAIKKPSFAFINGTALGGGLEVVLYADQMSIASNAKAIGLPEVGLGLVPGWGGTWLLSHLIGPQAAARVFLEGPVTKTPPLTGAAAFALGIGDAAFDDPNTFLDDSLAWAGAVLSGTTSIARVNEFPEEEWAAAIASAEALLGEQPNGGTWAAQTGLDLLRLMQHAPADEGFAAEDAALAAAVDQPETQAALAAWMSR